MRIAGVPMKRRLAVVLVSSALCMAGLPGGLPQAAACGGMEQLILTTLQVKMKPLAKSYKIGQVAKFEVTVMRPSETDPLGQNIVIGEPPEQFPAEDVNVGVGIQVGYVYLPGYGTTDANGKAIVGVKIENYTRPGMAHAKVLSRETVAETSCLTVEEQGYRFLPNAFKVSR